MNQTCLTQIGLQIKLCRFYGLTKEKIEIIERFFGIEMKANVKEKIAALLEN